MELKAYKMLSEIRGSILSRIFQESRNVVEFNSSPEKMEEKFRNISNPGKWDYCGLLSKEDKRTLEVLEYLINDDRKEIFKYKDWDPSKI